MLSAVQSAATTPYSQTSTLPQSPQSPTPPSPPSPYQMHLSSHVLLQGSGLDGSSVTALHHLEHGFLLAMQCNGYDHCPSYFFRVRNLTKACRFISLISDEDGSCISRVDLSSSNLCPPVGTKEMDHPPICWHWERMRILETTEVGSYSIIVYPLCSHAFSCSARTFLHVRHSTL